MLKYIFCKIGLSYLYPDPLPGQHFILTKDKNSFSIEVTVVVDDVKEGFVKYRYTNDKGKVISCLPEYTQVKKTKHFKALYSPL